MAARDRPKKTNAMRVLERAGIAFVVLTYAADDGSPASGYGAHVAELLGKDPASTFKTLVAVGASGGYVVCCIPAAEELDLKKAASAAGEKSLTMLRLRDLEPVTGYVRGGCSPIGMRARLPILIDETVQLLDEVSVSGGRRGLSLTMAPDDLVSFTDAMLADLCREGR